MECMQIQAEPVAFAVWETLEHHVDGRSQPHTGLSI